MISIYYYRALSQYAVRTVISDKYYVLSLDQIGQVPAAELLSSLDTVPQVKG